MKTLRTALLSLLCVAMMPLGSTLLADAAGAAGLPSLAQALEGSFAAQAAFIRRNVIKKSPVTGYRVIVVVGDDSTNEVASVDVSLNVEGGPEGSIQGVALGRPIKPNGNKRYVFTFYSAEGGIAPGAAVQVTSTQRDSAGVQVGESKTQTVIVEDDGDAVVRSVTLRQMDPSNFELKVLVVSDSEEEVASLDVTFDDDLNDGSLPTTSQLTLTNPGRSGGRALFITQTLTFREPAGVPDQVYAMDIDLKNSRGQIVGSSVHEIVAEGLDVAGGNNFNGVCWDGIQNGSETAIDCGGHCSPCPVPVVFDVYDASDLLDALAGDAVAEAAAALGVVVEPGTVGYEVSAAGALAWSAGLEDGGTLVVADGFSAVIIDGGSLVLEDSAAADLSSSDIGVGGGNWFLMSSSSPDDITVTHHVTAYSARTGGIIGRWDFDDSSCQGISRVNLAGGAVSGQTPTGVVVYDTAMYGDIILGGMRLDDFND